MCGVSERSERVWESIEFRGASKCAAFHLHHGRECGVEWSRREEPNNSITNNTHGLAVVG
jgi:hypothetical protein